VISAVTSRGGNGRGNRAPREVFPLLPPQVPCSPRATQRRLDAPAVCSNCNQRRDLLAERSGRRSLPPGPVRPRLPDGQSQNRGVSDHEIWPDLRSCPRPRKRSLTPRCLCLSRSRRSPRCDRRRPQRRAQSAPSLHRPSHSIVRFAVARSRRSALLRPRVRAAGGLDRPIREPLESNYRRPRVNLLTNARPRRYRRILFDGCGPQPPSHRPM
jgi:hypothetical protein